MPKRKKKKRKKGKRGKRISEQNYINAYNIMYGQWTSIAPCDYIEGEKDANEPSYISTEVIISDMVSAEEQVIKKQEWHNLSDEAKEIITTIVFGPSEILEIIKTPQRKLLTKKSIMKYFRQIWKSKFISGYTIKEIVKWVNQL